MYRKREGQLPPPDNGHDGANLSEGIDEPDLSLVELAEAQWRRKSKLHLFRPLDSYIGLSAEP